MDENLSPLSKLLRRFNAEGKVRKDTAHTPASALLAAVQAREDVSQYCVENALKCVIGVGVLFEVKDQPSGVLVIVPTDLTNLPAAIEEVTALSEPVAVGLIFAVSDKTDTASWIKPFRLNMRDVENLGKVLNDMRDMVERGAN